MSRSGRTQILSIYLFIGVITASHYLTGPHQHQLHDVYRRLYYLPIILAAFRNGLPGGLIAAVVVCVAYLPHATGHISHDPASNTQKILEMVLYLAVGVITGALVSRLKGVQRHLESTAADLKQSLDQLRSAEESLVREAKLAAVGRLSAGLAHEIRNPLASIKGSAEILADDFAPEHPKRRMLQVLVDEAVRLNAVLSRFLAFARPAAVATEHVSIAGEIEPVTALLSGRAEGKRPLVSFAFDPRACGSARMIVDPSQIRQVLLNVILNAQEASPEGGTVRIACWTRGDRAIISVHDSGPGFTAEALTSACTPFFTTKPEGTGLGLAISNRIVEQHGGEIRLSNHPHGGGLVEIELPAEKGPAPSLLGRVGQENGNRNERNGDNGRVQDTSD